MHVEISLNDTIEENEVLELYKANKWSAAKKPQQLMASLRHSHTLVTARISGKLVGLGNALSDGHLVVYYSHLLVAPQYQLKGIGRKMMEKMRSRYANFHQQILLTDKPTVEFYKALGFKLTGDAKSMWIYSGNDH